jgi:formylglycine-generating enzyme required for sulfatase activity
VARATAAEAAAGAIASPSQEFVLKYVTLSCNRRDMRELREDARQSLLRQSSIVDCRPAKQFPPANTNTPPRSLPMLSRCRSAAVKLVAILSVAFFSMQGYVCGAEQPDGEGASKAKTESPAARSASDPEKTLLFDLGKEVKLELVLIPAGSFMMGDSNGSEDQRPAHKVNITRPFYMGKYETTLAQFEAIMGSRRGRFGGGPPPANTTNPAATPATPATSATPPTSPANSAAPATAATPATEAAPASAANPTRRASQFPRTPQDPRTPASFLTWESCQAFVAKLNEKFPESGGKFAVPSEAQWEYACRAGTTTKYSFGDTGDNCEEYAWFRSIAGGKAHPVGEKKPNPWGLYDMHGNVWEWVNDWYDRDYYKTSPTDDPTGPASGISAVIRGGGWNDDPKYGTSVYRNRNVPKGVANDQGVRVIFTR